MSFGLRNVPCVVLKSSRKGRRVLLPSPPCAVQASEVGYTYTEMVGRLGGSVNLLESGAQGTMFPFLSPEMLRPTLAVTSQLSESLWDMY